jgi:hypothetical protein
MDLMMTEPDPKRITFPSQECWEIIKKEITGLSASVCLMPNFLNWNRVLFSFRGDFWSHW